MSIITDGQSMTNEGSDNKKSSALLVHAGECIDVISTTDKPSGVHSQKTSRI